MFNLFIQKCNKYQYFNKYISIFSNEYKRSTSSLSTNTIKETPKLTKQNSLFAFSTESSSQNSTLNASNSSNKKSVNFIIAPYFIQPLISDINKVNEIIKNYNENNNKSTYFNSKCIIMNKIASLASNEDNLYLRYKIPFALLENADANEEKFIESCESIITEAEAQMMFLEWEDDGRPNAVIQNQIMTSKEREAAQKAKEAERASYHKNLMKEMDASDASKKKAHGILTAIENAKTRLEELNATTDEDSHSLSARKQKVCDDLKKEYGEDLNITDETKQAFTELKDLQFMDEAAIEKLNGINTAFMEEFHEEAEIANAAEKPEKKDLATRIQNKALDKEAKDLAQMAKVDEKVQKLKNAANAVSQKPKRFSDSITKFCKDFDRWDDNRRKEFFAKPGFRHKLFRNLKLAIYYGTAAKLKLTYVPIAALMRHFSKTKDKRIRNELSLELENEIKICEEKISDANSAGDNERKYELMRIRDKLNAERTRVRLNSKYI